MSRSTRLFEIIQLLRQSDGPVTAQWLADELEVAKRTIYRDIAALQMMHLPIEGEAGIGYVMRSGFDLPPLMFSPDEIEAIVVGLALVGRTGDPGLEQSAQNAAFKIADVLPQERSFDAPLRVSRWNAIPEPQVDPEALRADIRAARELRIVYVDQVGDRTVRNIWPVALVYYIDALLLAAWCNLRQDFRHFRLDRIQTCKATGKDFKAQKDRLLDAWEDGGHAP